VHPAALFALTEAEIVLHAETSRDHSWRPINPSEDAQDIDGDAGGEGERQDNVSNEGEGDIVAEQERDDDGVEDDGAANENARPDCGVDDEPSVTPVRSRAAPHGRVAAA